MLRKFALILFALLALFMVGCSEDEGDETVAGSNGQLLLSGSCVGRNLDASITCQDDSTISSTSGTPGRLTSIVFDFRLGGVSRHTRQAGLTTPPRQVTVSALESGTWTINHKVQGYVGDQLYEGERSHVVTVLSAADANAVLGILEEIAKYEDPSPPIFIEGKKVASGNDELLVKAVRSGLEKLPPTTCKFVLEEVRRNSRVNLDVANADEIRQALQANGGTFGLRTKILLQMAAQVI